jgi:hypothetical protein
MDEATRAAYYAAEAELEEAVRDDFDLDELERLYLIDRDAAAEMLSQASPLLTVKDAKALLQRVYGELDYHE